MRSLDYRDSRVVQSTRKATDIARPESALSGCTLWGTRVGDDANPQVPISRPTSRCNHLQNMETRQPQKAPQTTMASNHFQNLETQPLEKPARADSRINNSHLSGSLVEKAARSKVVTSRINEGSIVFGAAEVPKRPPPPRVEPFQDRPQSGSVKQILPGFTDSYKFGPKN